MLPVCVAGPCSKTSRTYTAPVSSPVMSNPSPASGSVHSRLTVTGPQPSIKWTGPVTLTGPVSAASVNLAVDDWPSTWCSSDNVSLGGLAGRRTAASSADWPPHHMIQHHCYRLQCNGPKQTFNQPPSWHAPVPLYDLRPWTTRTTDTAGDTLGALIRKLQKKGWLYGHLTVDSGCGRRQAWQHVYLVT